MLKGHGYLMGPAASQTASCTHLPKPQLCNQPPWTQDNLPCRQQVNATSQGDLQVLSKYWQSLLQTAAKASLCTMVISVDIVCASQYP